VVRRTPQDEKRRSRYYQVQPGAPPHRVYAPHPAPHAPPPGHVEPAPAPAPLVTREVEEVSRHLTVQCAYALVDAATGELLLQYATPPIQKKDKAAPDFFFGGMVDESKLDPVDHFIGELVEEATLRFAGMIVPVRFEQTYELVGRDKLGERAVRLLRAGDVEQSLQLMREQYHAASDKFETVFALGTITELNARYEEALKRYREAAAMDDADDDEADLAAGAAKRLSDHLPRIVPEGAAPPPDPQPAVQSGEIRSDQ
jgi:hypothetical protein